MCLFVNTLVVKDGRIYSDEVNDMYYNEKIQYVRESMNLTQKQVAEALNIKQQQYARYEKGINEMPLHHLKNLCSYLGVSADYILGLPKNLNYIEK